MLPLIFSKRITEKLVRYLHHHHAYITHKFPDAPWSKKYGVLFLPLGQHVHTQEIVSVCEKIAEFFTHE
jgi:hypothetical protein